MVCISAPLMLLEILSETLIGKSNSLCTVSDTGSTSCIVLLVLVIKLGLREQYKLGKDKRTNKVRGFLTSYTHS